jgi:hypothetical protein
MTGPTQDTIHFVPSGRQSLVVNGTRCRPCHVWLIIVHNGQGGSTIGTNVTLTVMSRSLQFWSRRRCPCKVFVKDGNPRHEGTPTQVTTQFAVTMLQFHGSMFHFVLALSTGTTAFGDFVSFDWGHSQRLTP